MASEGPQLCLRSSRRPIWRRCTSSGPSAKRSVREWAHMDASGNSWLTPPPPWSWMARSTTRSVMLGTATLISAIACRAALLPTVSIMDAAHRLLLVLGGVLRVGLAHEDEDLAARVADARRPPFEAVDHVVVAAADDRGFDVRRVRGGHLGLGHREGGADLALEQRLEPLRLLLGRAVPLQDLHVAGVGRRAVEHFRRDRRAAHDLAEGRVLRVGEPRAALALGEK